MSYRLISQGANFKYETVIRSNNQSAAQKLANELLKQPDIVKFNVHPMGE